MAEGGQGEERFSTDGKSFEDALRLVLAGGSPREPGSEGEEPRLSEDELRQLEERVQERYSDSGYRDRLRQVTPTEESLRQRHQ